MNSSSRIKRLTSLEQQLETPLERAHRKLDADLSIRELSTAELESLAADMDPCEQRLIEQLSVAELNALVDAPDADVERLWKQYEAKYTATP